MTTKLIVYFDGVCTLCNHCADFIVQRGSSEVFALTSLQGETAKKRLPPKYQDNLDSVIVEHKGIFYTHGDGAIYILKYLPKPWSYVGILLSILPKKLLHSLYLYVASRRYKLFGKEDLCRLPSQEEKEYFLP